MKILLTVAIAGALLTGCDTAKDAFGLNRSQPDEFSVNDNPPLTIPKEFQIVKPVDVKQEAKKSDPSQAAVKVLTK